MDLGFGLGRADTSTGSANTSTATGFSPRADEAHTRDAATDPATKENTRRRRRYGPRSCRICLETVEPIWPPPSPNIIGSFMDTGRPSYVSEEPELGRLISPCLCKGSQKYVHEGCLQAWRVAQPDAWRHYWRCPTCHFDYNISRLSWASYLKSRAMQLAITVAVLAIAVFALGFVADPIISLWSDPLGTIVDTAKNVVADLEALRESPPRDKTAVTWLEHWVKGFFSLGLLGFLKVLVTMSPFQIWHVRQGIPGTGRRPGADGRARIENVSLLVVLLGAGMFLLGVWNVVRKLSAKVLEGVSDHVVDIGGDDGDEDDGGEDEDGGGGGRAKDD